MSYLSDYCAARGIDQRLYTAWMSMRWRCNNPNRKDYRLYGGRGVKVCGRWNTFSNFAADMGPHPGKGYSLDKKKHAKLYCKANCRWATATEQNRNRRRSRNSDKLTAADVAAIRRLYPGDNRRLRTGVTQRTLAKQYGVARTIISRIVNRKCWL